MPSPYHRAPRTSRPRATPEADEQAELIRWRDLFVSSEPRLKWLHASLNGVKLTKGQAAKAKVGGMTAGVWDLFLPVPICHGPSATHISVAWGMPVSAAAAWSGPAPAASWSACGLYIEMKSATGTVTKEQRSFADGCAGYRFAICRSWSEAALVICEYLRLPPDHPARKGAGG